MLQQRFNIVRRCSQPEGSCLITQILHFSFKMEDDGELPKTLVKLRRTPSDTPRPASTPPVIAASAIQDEDDEEKIIAELEVRPLIRSLRGGSCC